MDMRKFRSGRFLRVEPVRNTPTPMSGRIEALKDGIYGKPNVHFDNGDILALNMTNVGILIDAYGPDSDDWIGKRVGLTVGKVPYQGAVIDSIVINPILPPINAAETEKPAEKTKKPAVPIDDDIPF
jgi:hypothetical protein